MNISTQWVAVVAAIFLSGLSVFQILLAAGLPLGRAAFGGENPVLPRNLRLVSAFSALIFAAAVYLDLARSDLLGGVGHSSAVARIGMWVLVVILGVSTLANVASRSRWERYVMAPIALLLTICCLTVALS